MSITPGPGPPDPSRPIPRATPLADERLAPLRRLVTTAVMMLCDLRTLHPDVVSGRLEHDLRRELERLAQSLGPALATYDLRAAVAVRTACAHLATRAYEDAYLAFVAAQGQLSRPAHPPA